MNNFYFILKTEHNETHTILGQSKIVHYLIILITLKMFLEGG